MRITPVAAWWDIWIGAYWDRSRRHLYLMIPFFGVRLELRKRRHKLVVFIDEWTCAPCQEADGLIFEDGEVEMRLRMRCRRNGACIAGTQEVIN